MNISKFGERIMWLGAGAGRAWLFDMRAEEGVLYCASEGEGWTLGAEGGLPVTPARLLGLAGLKALPDGPATVAYAPADDAWVVWLESDRGDRLVFLDRGSGLPVRVEERDSDGQVRASSTIKLARYEPVRSGGLPGGPAFPTLIDISTTGGGGAVRLALRSPNDEVEERFFDLEWLTRMFAPRRMEGPCGQVARE